MPLSQVTNDTVRADPAYSTDTYLLPAYEWLAEQIGFFPHFISVGNDEWAIHRTGYQENGKVGTGGDIVQGEYKENLSEKRKIPQPGSPLI